MRVAVVFGTFPPARNGGADFVARLAPALAASGAEVHVLTSTGGGPERDEVSEGVTVHRAIGEWTLSENGRGTLRRMNELLRSEEIDVIHVLFPDSVLQGRYQLPAALGVRRIPLVTTFWNLGLGRRSPLPIKLEALGLLGFHLPAFGHLRGEGVRDRIGGDHRHDQVVPGRLGVDHPRQDPQLLSLTIGPLLGLHDRGLQRRYLRFQLRDRDGGISQVLLDHILSIRYVVCEGRPGKAEHDQ